MSFVHRFAPCSVVAVCAHRLVAGEHGAQRVDCDIAELGRDREQVVDARRFVVLAALDVAPDERGDREVLFGELRALCPARVVGFRQCRAP